MNLQVRIKMIDRQMKKIYKLNVILGLILGCLFVNCKHEKDARQKEDTSEISYNQDFYEKINIREPEIYDYSLTITDAEELLRTSNIQRGWRDEPPLKMTTSQISALNGIYEWQSSIAFKTQREMFDYICEHYKEMQTYKVDSAPVSTKPVNTSKSSNIYDEYQDRLDEYLDDPEDEITFDPEVFDFQDD